MRLSDDNLGTAFAIEGAARGSDWVVTCDHATNIVPDCVGGGDLGLPAADMERHIAYDIGALGVARALGELMDAAVISSRFSRLVIDPNRSEDDPTALMRLYDGSLIPANRHADAGEKERRLAKFHRPYHDALSGLITQRPAPVIASIHSFTPQLKGRPPRPYEIGVLYNRDKRLSAPLLDVLRAEGRYTIGDNQPYTGYLEGDAMDRHALQHGHLHVLIEIRNDLIETEANQHKWADYLAPHLMSALTHAKE